ncbi:MAG: hypothetical protein ACUVQP_00125 [Bacteroidales bacterium]
MRQIRTIEDAQIAIRELYDFVDLMRSKDIDLSKRRVKNASPSEDLYDYVVRKELNDLKEETGVIAQGIAVEYYTVVFTTRYSPIVDTISSNYYIFNRKSVLQKVSFVAIAAPSGSFTWNVLVNGDDLFASNISITSSYSAGTVLNYTSFNMNTFNVNDLLNIKVLSSGGIIGVTIEFYFKVGEN